MVGFRIFRTIVPNLTLVAALGATLAAAGCGSVATASPALSPGAASPGHGLVLRFQSVGGFVAPVTNYTRIPTFSLYADGRVIVQQFVPTPYPPPALPYVFQRRISTRDVNRLVAQARAAGVGTATDFGTPGIADATSTRFTLAGARTTEVYALSETPDTAPDLTPRQRAARNRLSALVAALTDLPGTLGIPVEHRPAPYLPTAIAALSRPWTPIGSREDSPVRAWPGAALPGRPLGGTPLSCVTTTGTAAAQVLAAAQTAHANSPWIFQGKRWSIVFRPLLPDEHGCSDLG
jgi:hypothetical protein